MIRKPAPRRRSPSLTASDLLVQSRLEVADAVVYDNIIMQRKSAEAGNTGVDFVITKED